MGPNRPKRAAKTVDMLLPLEAVGGHPRSSQRTMMHSALEHLVPSTADLLLLSMRSRLGISREWCGRLPECPRPQCVKGFLHMATIGGTSEISLTLLGNIVHIYDSAAGILRLSPRPLHDVHEIAGSPGGPVLPCTRKTMHWRVRRMPRFP